MLGPFTKSSDNKSHNFNACNNVSSCSQLGVLIFGQHGLGNMDSKKVTLTQQAV